MRHVRHAQLHATGRSGAAHELCVGLNILRVKSTLMIQLSAGRVCEVGDCVVG